MTTTTNTATLETRLARDPYSNWIKGTWNGLLVTAKVYDEPSEYGMELDGRISKLWIATPDTASRLVLYNYDRGLDVDYIKPEVLAEIVAALAAVIDR